MNISKSRFTAYHQCPKMMWLKIYKPEEEVKDKSLETRMEDGHRIGALARGLFGQYADATVLNEDGTPNIVEMIKRTRELIAAGATVIAEASFSWDGFFCSVDMLRITEDRLYELYEVKSSSVDMSIEKDVRLKKKQYAPDCGFQKLVLSKIGLPMKSSNIVLINSQFVKSDKPVEQELSKLFCVINMDDVVNDEYMETIRNMGHDAMTLAHSESEPEQCLGGHCKKPYDCPFMQYCLAQRGISQKDPVMNMYRMFWTKKAELIESRCTSMEDLQNVATNANHKLQLSVLKSGVEHINPSGIQKWLDTVTYPLYFLDFETQQDAIPEYTGTFPYQQVPFQYSLHIKQTKDSPLEHREFLGDPNRDPRYDIAKSLVENIPADACVIAYNKAFECTRIKELATSFPELSEHLLSIEANIIDLMNPFVHFDYYTPEMNGSFSIKSVLPALFPNSEELNYHNLNENVQNGTMAMTVYPAMRHMNEAQIAETRAALLAYCKLDTLAMVRVMDKLYEAVGDPVKEVVLNS